MMKIILLDHINNYIERSNTLLELFATFIMLSLSLNVSTFISTIILMVEHNYFQIYIS